MGKITRIVNLKNDPYDIYIGRGSKWGCPYTIIKDRPTLASEIVDSKEEALAKYKEYVLNSPELMDSLDELEGKTLGCFCMPSDGSFPIPFICHGQVLVELLTKRKLQKLLKQS
jgi:hypothetical protein